MLKQTRKYVVCVVVAMSWLLLITGCEPTTSLSLSGDSSALSTDLSVFIQQFAREALAAFLF